ncbi:hypothetical protein CDCA_CDCA02G0577 [Cyanidium caldarium]|uniref:Sphingomyelin phosphodiesterase 4 n=1 Tax=Cyanidium caldarium TaxID=2771 RepID=A0AAV9IQA9_CYACA|nr:hypothetical protein CDCA_CDCA02G0577 [Cyanidium caldarium]
MDDWLGRARGGAGEGHPSFSADRSGWWNGGSGTSADDLRLALTGDVATRGVVLQLQAVFQAALDGREDFQAISGLLPDCVSCVFGYSRGGTGGPSGWLERAELSDTGGGDVAGLVELLGPRGPLFRCLLRYHAEYAYEFPLSNFPAHTVREVWALWRRGVRRSDATSSSEVVQPGGAVPSTASPLSRYLAERLHDVHGETARIGAAAYYVFCLLAYPLWHELPESDDRRGGATSAVRSQHVYERLVLAFWRNCSDRVRDQQLCLRAGGAEDAPSLFVCAMLELWFNWNGELAGSSASWAQDRGAAPLRPMAYRPLSRLTLRCQAVVVHDFLQRLSPAALSASLPPGTAGARNGGRLSDARSSPGTLLQASALEPGTLRGADVTSLAAALRGQPAMSARASGTPDSDFDELYRGGGVPWASWLYHQYIRFFHHSMHAALSAAMDLSPETAVALMQLFRCWLLPWEEAPYLRPSPGESAGGAHRRLQQFLQLTREVLERRDRHDHRSRYDSQRWAHLVEQRAAAYREMLALLLRFITRSRCILRSAAAMLEYHRLYCGLNSRELEQDLRGASPRAEHPEHSSWKRPGRWSVVDADERCAEVLDRDQLRESMRELRAQIEKRLLSGWSATAPFSSRSAREKSEHWVDPWVRLFDDETHDGRPEMPAQHAPNVDGPDASAPLLPERLSEVSALAWPSDRNDTADMQHSPTRSVAGDAALGATTSSRSALRLRGGRSIPRLSPQGREQVLRGERKCSNLDVVPLGDVWDVPPQSTEWAPALRLAHRLAVALERQTGMRWNTRWLASYVALLYLGLLLLLMVPWW